MTNVSWSTDIALYLLDYLVILNYLPISAYSGLLKLDMTMFVNIARLDIGQLFTQSARRGHPCSLDISSSMFFRSLVSLFISSFVVS